MSSAARVRGIVRWKAFVRALSGPVRANCDCHVSLCLLLQDKVADVTKLRDKCMNSSTRGSVTIAEIAQGAACCEPPHPVTAELFCEAMSYLAQEGSAACDKIASAGGIPVIVQLLARLPDEKEVVYWGCSAVYHLAFFQSGSASIKSLILAQPDIIALLRAASTRLQAWGKRDTAAWALKKLGMGGVCVVC
jgi:hypothetical protein